MPDLIISQIEEKVNKVMKQLATDFDPVKEIKEIYPHRIIFANKYNKKFNSDRRAFGEFFTADAIRDISEISKKFSKVFFTPRAKSWGDILIAYILDKSPKKLNKTKNIIEKKGVLEPRLMVAIPKDPKNLFNRLLLIKTIKILWKKEINKKFKKHWKNELHRLLSQMKTYMKWDMWQWYYMGGIIESENNISDNEIISVFIENLYPKSIKINDKSLSLIHSSNSYRRKRVKNLLNNILNLNSLLVTTRQEDDNFSKLIFNLEDLSLVKKISSKGWKETWEVTDKVPQDSSAKPAWNFLYSHILEQTRIVKKVSFKSIIPKLLGEPFGISPSLAKVIISLFWRRYHHKITLYNFRSNKEQKVDTLTFQRLVEIFKHPDYWGFGYREINLNEIEYIKGFIKIFCPNFNEDYIVLFLWEKAFNTIKSWYKEKPLFLSSKNYSSPYPKLLLKTLMDNQKTDATDFLLNKIPKIFGIKPSIEKTKEDFSKILKLLKETINEIDTLHKKIFNSIIEDLMETFGSSDLGFEKAKDEADFQKQLTHWLYRVNAHKHTNSFSKDALTLFGVLNLIGDIRSRFIYKLPRLFGMKDIMEWKFDYSKDLLARINAARYEIEMANFLQIKECKDEKNMKKYLIEAYLRYFKILNISSEEKKKILKDYLKELKSQEA